MSDVTEEILNRYEILIGDREALRQENKRLYFKNDCIAKQLDELSHTITVLKRTIECHDDFIDSSELREDYEKFKDKWLEGGNV